MSHSRRKLLADSAPWRKKTSDLFPFGFNYALIITVFGIILMLNIPVPIISIAGCVFFFTKFVVDSFNILSVHLK